MKITTMLGIVGVGCVLSAVAIARFKPSSTVPSFLPLHSATPSSLPTPIATSNPVIVDELRRGGSSFRDPQGLYTFLYPSVYVLDDKDPQHLRVYLRAKTQRSQSEISDGVLLVFETLDIGGQPLEKVVDTTIARMTKEQGLELSQPKQKVTMNTHQGFSYGVKGQGSATVLVLQKSPQSPSALSITSSVMDPTNKGYQAVVDAIIATLELYK